MISVCFAYVLIISSHIVPYRPISSHLHPAKRLASANGCVEGDRVRLKLAWSGGTMKYRKKWVQSPASQIFTNMFAHCVLNKHPFTRVAYSFTSCIAIQIQFMNSIHEHLCNISVTSIRIMLASHAPWCKAKAHCQRLVFSQVFIACGRGFRI